MSVKVVFFSRNGNSKRVAQKISSALTCEMAEITTKISWKFFWGFIKGGYYTSTDKSLDIDLLGEVKSDDELIIVTPLWAGKACQPVRIFLRNHNNPATVVFTSAGSISTEKDGLGHIKGTYDIVKKFENEDDVIKNVIDKFSNN
ncbi:MAG: flavodoxin family protein [Spirochaetales bacterium]|nr:flavodoxin family protein [Spirochaetales bacterium]